MTTEYLPFAFLPVFKKPGPTSHDVVAKVRRLLPRKTKIGHTGTLDPFASGVLILAVGKATRFSDDIHLFPKSYHATIRLGVRTDTLDLTGQEDAAMPVPEGWEDQLIKVAEQFTGELDQMPPIYSAKKIGGKKSYELARQNKSVELSTRRVTIHNLKLTPIDGETLSCHVSCSTGTYIRSLGRDIAEALGTVGHLIQLERTGVGPINGQNCPSPDDLTPENLGQYLVPVPKVLPQFPELNIPTEVFRMLIQGRPYQTAERFPKHFLGVYQSDDQIQAIFRCEYDEMVKVLNSKMLCYQA